MDASASTEATIEPLDTPSLTATIELLDTPDLYQYFLVRKTGPNTITVTYDGIQQSCLEVVLPPAYPFCPPDIRFLPPYPPLQDIDKDGRIPYIGRTMVGWHASGLRSLLLHIAIMLEQGAPMPP